MGGLGSLGANAASLAGGIAQRTTSRGGSTQIAQAAEKSIFANSSETQASHTRHDTNNSSFYRGAEPSSATDNSASLGLFNQSTAASAQK